MNSAYQFKIVSNGLPKTEIIVNGKATLTEMFAAHELQKYIRRISNCTLPIKKKQQVSAKYVIFVGESEVAQESGIKPGNRETDGFTIKTIKKHLFLVGNNPRATLYAVYHLLEILGCRWYELGKAGEVVPRTKDINLEQTDITEKPDFDMRSFWLLYLNKEDNISVIDWMTKNKMNWIECAHEHTNYDEIFSPISEELRKRGTQILFGTHTLEPTAFGLDQKLLETKREYFALVNGKRGGAVSQGHKLRICYSNPEARHLVAMNIVEFCKKRPDIKGCYILFRDTYPGWCECENCRAIQPYKIDPLNNLQKVSDIYAYFIDKLTDELKQTLPGMKFFMFSVYKAREIPENPDLLSRNPNVGLMLDQYARCHTHFINDGDCKKNMMIKKDNMNWRKVFPGKVYIYDMAAGAFDYSIGMVSPRSGLIKESISFGKRIKASGMTTNWEDSQALPSNQYLFARLLWNSRLNINEIKKEFFKKYYGSSGELMERYAEEFGEYPHNFKTYSGHRDQRFLLAYLKDQKLSKLKMFLKLAVQSATQKEFKDRVKKENERLELMELWKKLQDTMQEAHKIAGKKVVDRLVILFFSETVVEGKKKEDIDFHRIRQLEKKAKSLFFAIVNHKDPGNKKGEHAWRRKIALPKYNKIRMLLEKENHRLHNGGFEEGEKNFIPFWEPGAGGGTIDTKVCHSGRKSFCFSCQHFGHSYSITQTVILKQKEVQTIKFGGWYKTKKVEGGKDSEFVFKIQIPSEAYKWKSSLEEKILLKPGTHSWQKGEKVIRLDVPVKEEITFCISFRHCRGKVWFDDIFLEEI